MTAKTTKTLWEIAFNYRDVIDSSLNSNLIVRLVGSPVMPRQDLESHLEEYVKRKFYPNDRTRINFIIRVENIGDVLI